MALPATLHLYRRLHTRGCGSGLCCFWRRWRNEIGFDGVASLIDKSFLRQSEPEGQEPRLLMLETIREYGWECLNGSGEMEESRHAHAAYYLHLAEQIDPHLRSAQQAVWLACLGAEHDNLRAALRWSIDHGEKEMAVRLGGALWYYWELCGHLGMGEASSSSRP